MKAMLTISAALWVLGPEGAQAEVQPVPLHASHCVGALIDNHVLMTSAMVPVAPDAVGRSDADPRSEMFTVPQEDMLFSILDVVGVRSCLVKPLASAATWARDEVEQELQDSGLSEAPACRQEDTVLWFLPGLNEAGRAVTVAVTGSATEVREILAFETLEVSNPEECRDAG